MSSANENGSSKSNSLEDLATGRPVVIYSEDSGEYKLQKENLRAILLQDGVREFPVMVLSIAGGVREGKSFILNFLVKYLESGMVCSVSLTCRVNCMIVCW